MGEHYSHLTWRERLKMETRLKDEWKPQAIADENGMLRRRPRGTGFKKVSRKKLRETTDWINNHPWKIFGFHTAAEHFAEAFPGLPNQIVPPYPVRCSRQ